MAEVRVKKRSRDPTFSKYMPEQWNKMPTSTSNGSSHTVQQHYKLLTSRKEIHRAREYWEKGGLNIRSGMLSTSCQSRSSARLRAEHIPVHDRDLHELALTAGETLQHPQRQGWRPMAL